jgi:hypothetical protein
VVPVRTAVRAEKTATNAISTGVRSILSASTLGILKLMKAAAAMSTVDRTIAAEPVTDEG